MLWPMTKPLKLYRSPYSGHSHRVQLFLSLLELPVELIDVDLAQGAHRAPSYLAKNPLGQVPVLEDGELTLADSNAILVYLALRYDASQRWYPRDPVLAAQVQRFLSLAAGELSAGPGALRLAALFRREVEREKPEALSARLFGLLESTLSKTPYLVGDAPTIADLALYTYSAHAPEGGVTLEPYPALRAWLARVESLPHFVPMKRLA
ncbi:MAG: glutathione S-transferase [Myxococcaceae bacterium]|nr:glutathione S-transferase [Myxococcaceae bacterium]